MTLIMKKINIIVIIVIVIAVFPMISLSETNRKASEPNVGILYRDRDDTLFLAIPDSTIEPGSRVVICTAPDKRVICCAETRAAGSLTPEGDRFALFDGKDTVLYPLLLEKEKKSEIELGFGIIGPPDVYSAMNNTIKLDLNKDGSGDSFRDCTSHEGVHLAICSGKPLESKRLWHAYYYLAYETEPSCFEKDYE